MNNIDYNLGILKRLVVGTINGKPYIWLDDAEYIIKNSGIFEEENKFTKPIEKSIMDLLDRRPSKWPDYYDACDAQDYHEWFIKGTNIKLGFDYIDGETNEHCWYCIVCDGYDQMDPYDSEEEFIKHLEWMLMNENLIWRYYE